MQKVRTSCILLIVFICLIGPFLTGVGLLELCRLLGVPFSPALLDRWIGRFLLFMIGDLLFIIVGVIIFAIRKRTGRHWNKLWLVAPAYLVLGIGLALVFMHFYIRSHYDRYEYIFVHSTEWAPAFLDSKFKEIKLNNTKDEVLQLMGQPLCSSEMNAGEVLIYSTIGHYRSVAERGFHQRQVVLKNGRVSKVIRRYCIAD